MTDPPTQAELVAAMKLQRTAFRFQMAALRFSSTPSLSNDELVEAAREYVKRMRAHQRAVDEAHEAFGAGQ